MTSPRLIPFSVALAMIGLASGVQAAIISSIPEMYAEASGTLGASNTSILGPGLRDPSTGTSPNGVDVLVDRTDPVGNNLFFHSYGANWLGTSFFGSRASGSGIYNGTGLFHFQQNLQVTSTASPVNFAFSIDNGEVSARCASCVGGGSAVFEFIISIDNLDDSAPASIVNSGKAALTINETGSAYMFVREGLAVDLADIPNNDSGSISSGGFFNNYAWNPTPMSMVLGPLAPGNYQIGYDLIATVTGKFADASQNCVSQAFFPFFEGGPNVNVLQRFNEARAGLAEVGEEGNGDIAGREGPGFYCVADFPGTTARSGDPVGDFNARLGITDVPEPGSLALIGAGLAAAFATGTCRKRSNLS